MLKSMLFLFMAAALCIPAYPETYKQTIPKVTPSIQQILDTFTIKELFALVLPYSYATYYVHSDLDKKRDKLYKVAKEDERGDYPGALEHYRYIALYYRAESLCTNQQQRDLLSNIHGPCAGEAQRCSLTNPMKLLVEFYANSLSFDDCITELLYKIYFSHFVEPCESQKNEKTNEEIVALNLMQELNPIFTYNVLYHSLQERTQKEGSAEEKALAAFLTAPDKVAAYMQRIGS
jgi:hypothetical protein